MTQLDVIIKSILLIETLFTMRAGVRHCAFVLLQMIMHRVLLFTSLLANVAYVESIFILLVLKGHCMDFSMKKVSIFAPLHARWV